MEIPTFKPAIKAVVEYIRQNSSKLSSLQNQTLSEIKRRLERLDVQVGKLLEINEKLEQKAGMETYFDPETDTFILSAGGQEIKVQLQRADPSIPIAMDNLTRGSAYDAGNSSTSDEEEQSLRLELESLLENYYQSAHKTLKLFGTIPELSKIKCPPITRVRNNLIEHTKEGATYTFGVGSTGPRVKPMYQGELVFNDEGLIPNTVEFIDAIVEGCINNSTQL